MVHRFLAVNSPIGRGILVIEAWIPSQALCEAAKLFQSGSYHYVVVVGSQMNSSENSPNYADLAAEHLEKLGLAKERIVRVALPYESTKRTFASARALDRLLHNSGAPSCCVDVYTIGAHARKSWIIFQSVLGKSYQVGVIVGPESSYNTQYWLLSGRGWWIVSRNLTGYLYSKCEIALR